MNQERRLKRLLKKVKKKYRIKDKIGLKIVNKKVEIIDNIKMILRDNTKKRNLPLMAIYHHNLVNPKRAPMIEVYPKNTHLILEEATNKRMEHSLAHELVHFLIRKYSKENNPEELRKILWKINRMIDHIYYS